MRSPPFGNTFRLLTMLACAAVCLVPARAPVLAEVPPPLGLMQGRIEGGETLSLARAVERAITQNRVIKQSRIALRLQEINYDNEWDRMFLPSVSFVTQASSSLTVAHLPGNANDANGNTTDTHGYPSTLLGLSLGSYKIFNFWKDWLAYESARTEWERQKEIYNESVRAQRIAATVAFFRYKTELEKLDAAKRSVDISEAIVQLLESRIRVGKATERDVSSSKVDLLNAQNQYNQQFTQTKSRLWALNLLLGDPVDTPYTVAEKIQYAPIRLSEKEALRIYFDHGPNIKNARKDLKKAEIAVELAQKARLPLPTVSLSGINLAFANGYYHSGNELYTGSVGSANIDVSASINFSIPLVGPGGLFDRRTSETASLARDLSEIQYVNVGSNDQTQINNLVMALKQTEQAIANTKEAFESSSALLNNLFSQLTGGNINRLELRDAINQARASELQLEDSIVAHLEGKLFLAQTIGVDHLPGDSY